MDTKSRIAELELIIANKKATMSKTSFRSWYCRAAEVIELCELKAAAQSDAIATQRRNWKNDPATSKQIAYLNCLGVIIETDMTKGRASELIDAAKNSYLGSVGGWYRDGSN